MKITRFEQEVLSDMSAGEYGYVREVVKAMGFPLNDRNLTLVLAAWTKLKVRTMSQRGN